MYFGLKEGKEMLGMGVGVRDCAEGGLIGEGVRKGLEELGK